MIELFGQDGCESDDPVSLDANSGVPILVFNTMENCTPETILSGETPPRHVEWQFVCHNSDGKQGRLNYIRYNNGQEGYSCVMDLTDAELRVPNKRQICTEISQMLGSDIQQIAYVATFDYGFSYFFIVKSGGQAHVFPYSLGWGIPENELLSCLPADDSVNSFGISSESETNAQSITPVDKDAMFGILEELRNSRTGQDENGEFLSGGGPTLSIVDGKIVVAAATKEPAVPTTSPEKTALLCAGLLLVFVLLAYGPVLFRKKS